MASECTPVRGGGHDCSLFPAEAERQPRISFQNRLLRTSGLFTNSPSPKGTDKAGLRTLGDRGQQVGTVRPCHVTGTHLNSESERFAGVCVWVGDSLNLFESVLCKMHLLVS